MNSMKNSKVVSDWKPGLVSNKYRRNYDRIFERKNILADENLSQNTMDFYYFDRISEAEYEWMQNKGEIDG